MHKRVWNCHTPFGMKMVAAQKPSSVRVIAPLFGIKFIFSSVSSKCENKH